MTGFALEELPMIKMMIRMRTESVLWDSVFDTLIMAINSG